MSDDKFSEVIVERFARAWASIDGKVEAFDREKGKLMPDPDEWEAEGWTGHFDGYMAVAEELLKRAGCYVATRAPTTPTPEAS